MFNTYLRVRPQRVLAIPSVLTRSYAAKARTGKRGERPTGDQRINIMKHALYPPVPMGRKGPSPIGTYRSDVRKLLEVVIPGAEVHETITRAWMLHQRELREAREEDLRRKFECMKEALDELERVDDKLYKMAIYKPNVRKLTEEEREAMKGVRGHAARRAVEAKNERLFPRELRLPTDTPRRDGWDHDWKAKQ
ncbi:putative mitochondrial aconitate hydratase [Calocera cornea HHB12733]|uniref:Large ribosomal subunit protein mL40 n=1 Tax=Calocera cornea HHB12733 TaxID=1353952 RepID=A0A165ESA8_9BASI|nr:putative mitochondrial aconitate hydratase [Calocera cornea HHB12733]